MQVLLASFDLFKEVGGGQTFYRNLILRNPEVQFTYLRDSEAANAPRPENASAVPCQSRYIPLKESVAVVLEVPRWLHSAFVRASDVAEAVAGRHFDVVDVPDFEQFGLFLRNAFEHHHVSLGRIVLGMHGRISTSLELNWCVQSRDCIELTQLENMQYQAVDIRYFYSEMYRDEWRAIDPVPAPVVDPLWFFDVPRQQPYRDRPGPVDLNFVGRCEKRKGPDIFINLAWWLPRSCVRKINLIGPSNYDLDGTSSDVYVRQMVRNRRLDDVELVRCMTPAELAQVYATKSITFVPSVYDTLNFVALESLLAGCPTAIGSGAGVCRFLRERFPELPFEMIDVANVYEGVPRLEAILRNYRDYRHRLREAIEKQDLEPRGPWLIDVYQSPPAFDAALRGRLGDWYERLVGCMSLTTKAFRPHARSA
jgi:glycosyltransferase involved in cell wall biosynthesis